MILLIEKKYIKSVEGEVLANVKIEGSECVKHNAMKFMC